MANIEHTRTTRRAILSGIAATAAATAALAVPAASASSTDVDAVLAAWRAWWCPTLEWHRLAAESHRVWDSLPEEVRDPRVEINLDNPFEPKPSIARSARDIGRLTSTRAYLPMREKEKVRRRELRVEKLAELKQREDRAERVIIESGHRAIVERMVACAELSSAATEEIEAMTSTAPAAIAARCHLALDGLAQETPDVFMDSGPETRGLTFLIRDLLPQLPPEMAAAMAPVADGWRSLKDLWEGALEDGRAVS